MFSVLGVVGAPVVGQVYEVFLGIGSGQLEPIDLSPCATYLGLMPPVEPTYKLVNALLPKPSCRACEPPQREVCVARWQRCDNGRGFKTLCQMMRADGTPVTVEPGQTWEMATNNLGLTFCATVISVQIVPWDPVTMQQLRSFVLRELHDDCNDCLGIAPPMPCTTCSAAECTAYQQIAFPTVSFGTTICAGGSNTCCQPSRPVPGFLWPGPFSTPCGFGTTSVQGVAPQGLTCLSGCSGSPPQWTTIALSCFPSPADPNCAPHDPDEVRIWIITASFHSCRGDFAYVWGKTSPTLCPKGQYVFRGHVGPTPNCCGTTAACTSNLAGTVFEIS